jgi:hypothetical protein
MDKFEADETKTKLAVMQIELAGVRAEQNVMKQKVDLLTGKEAASAGFWSGTKGTVVLIFIILGGLVGAASLAVTLVGG